MQFEKITGTISDQFFTGIGINYRLLRFQGTIITPSPLIAHNGVQSHAELSSELSDTESFDTYTVSISKDVLSSLLGGNEAMIAMALSPGAIYELSEDNGATWNLYRVLGMPKVDLVRYTITLIGQGIGNA